MGIFSSVFNKNVRPGQENAPEAAVTSRSVPAPARTPEPVAVPRPAHAPEDSRTSAPAVNTAITTPNTASTAAKPRAGDAPTFQRDNAGSGHAASRKMLRPEDIDAIENEMSQQLAEHRRALQAGQPVKKPADNPLRSKADEQELDAIKLVESGIAPEIEEAAVMFANGQSSVCQALLESLIESSAADEHTLMGWWMLLDLYQINGQRTSFENLAIQFAQRFETSPPGWDEALSQSAEIHGGERGSIPTVAFSGKVDASNSRQIERARKLGHDATTLRIEMGRIVSIDAYGAQCILDLLKFLQRPTLRLILVGALELAEKIRPHVNLGDPPANKPMWLLLLELYRLLNMEPEYEDICVDYSVTFEVSPPQFVPPPHVVTMLEQESLRSGLTRDNHMLSLPPIIEGRCDELITKIQNHAAIYNPALLDCASLIRVDFTATGHLQAALATLAVKGKVIELHQVNHLVKAVFQLMGIQEFCRIATRKS